MFQLEHLAQVFRLEHIDDVFRLEHSLNVPVGTLERFPLNVPTGTFKRLFRLETGLTKRLSVPAGTLDTFCTQIHLVCGNSTLHSKHESLYSANSSGSSTIYGTRHRCCQSEGRRG
jgi:hypothetical protein